MMQYLLPLVEDCQQVKLACYAQSKSRVCYMGLPLMFIFKCFTFAWGSQFVESLTAGCTKNGPYYICFKEEERRNTGYAKFIEAVQLDEFPISLPTHRCL